MVPASLKGRYVIRFTVTSAQTRDEDIERDWSVIVQFAVAVLKAEAGDVETTPATAVGPVPVARPATAAAAAAAAAVAAAAGATVTAATADDNPAEMLIQQKRERLRRKDFGLSLILSNVPMSPKFINGSFAALFDNSDIIAEYTQYVLARQAANDGAGVDLNGSPMRMSPRKRFVEDRRRQYSFDHNLLSLTPASTSGGGGGGGGGGSGGGSSGAPTGGAGGGRGNGTERFRGFGTEGADRRRGSLDSKIEQIFQTTPEEGENDDVDDDNGGTGADAFEEKRRPSRDHDGAKVSRDDGVQMSRGYDGKGSHGRGAGGGCGGGVGGGGSDGVKMNGVASSPPPLPTTCKHCGHSLEE